MLFSSAQTGLSFHDLLCTGKYKGRRVLDICVEDMDYLRWMMDNGTIFADKVLRCIKGTHPKARSYGVRSNFDYKKYNKQNKTSEIMKKLFILFIVVVGFGVSSYGQAKGTATSTATIVTPISIVNNGDMNFGTIAVHATDAGTVLLPAASGSPTRVTTGGVTLPAVKGTVTAASFIVSGQANYTYALTLPSGDLTISSGGNDMLVNAWSSSPAIKQLSASGTQTIYIGATLNVAGGQEAGTYINTAGFDVTVNYN